MTITQMHTWFKLLIDKYKSPYFTDSEIDLFINRAMRNYLNEAVFDRRKSDEGTQIVSSAELSQNWEQLMYPLIELDLSVTSSSSKLLYTGIKTGFPANTDVIAILAVTDASGNEVKFLRGNNLGSIARNYFKRPSTTYRKFRIGKDALYLSPTSNGEIFKISALRTPIDVSKSGLVDCELPIVTHEKILAMAVDLAKITTEDEAMGVISGTTV